jgi:hypothetical protein
VHRSIAGLNISSNSNSLTKYSCLLSTATSPKCQSPTRWSFHGFETLSEINPHVPRISQKQNLFDALGEPIGHRGQQMTEASGFVVNFRKSFHGALTPTSLSIDPGDIGPELCLQNRKRKTYKKNYVLF